MEVVARHLKDRALALEDASDVSADLFGRSAFNRYYYSAFLLTRQLLLPIFDDLPSQHASIPDYLRGSVARELNKRKQRARRTDDHPSVKQAQDARQAALELADLLVLGYSARVAADYHPEVPISFYSQGFKLNEVRLADAESWPHKARTFATMILQAVAQTDDL